ncbi:lytic transglycosylase domain-containing protein [Pseudoduganella albidiflava]|uniref:Transglycosylase n=1 Tax=Pseudoduganella albidiflava TaxID=321983 RepID=A0A411WSY2_9BURK|nr:lytic transglycosylase domain-containing protein [Pseudoduganella albidiflava]QBH99757.1 lytic transglycosylase domain-containing protein [Pseudoduganella albidiflava]GGY62870.1 transglycosylase [Pseudoduganella albidiflava]
MKVGRERRRWWARPLRWWHTVAFATGVLCAPFGFAGNQKEESLADSVRLALSNAILDARPPKPAFTNPADQARYDAWLADMSGRLARKLPDEMHRREFLETVWYEARRAGLEPSLVLGLIQVESAYRKYAVSIVGARGYMQVMPFWTNVIGDRDRRKLFNMQTNLRYGCAILRMYIDMERGDLFLALGRYNGSRGKPAYPNAVLKAWNNWR